MTWKSANILAKLWTTTTVGVIVLCRDAKTGFFSRFKRKPKTDADNEGRGKTQEPAGWVQMATDAISRSASDAV